MGRHRPDPGGGGRFAFVIVAGVVLLALLAIGATAMLGLFSADGGASAEAVGGSESELSGAAASAQGHSLYIRVTGESTSLFVRVPGGDVLSDTTVHSGELLVFDQDELDVTIGDPAAVEVYVNGRLVDIADQPPDYSFTVTRRE
ncbi:DUF4115 domain-containing protein [Allonocardiopsis opalescens]|uniref:DUF4115 domain-containing protein n=1 Tax=Allonocardiopsis opalescens TaxID=1144618 RepID=UPI001FE9D338|nr:DUF4115 domain-containing protein [Allonocardiopsis opalescens]